MEKGNKIKKNASIGCLFEISASSGLNDFIKKKKLGKSNMKMNLKEVV